jgi:enoyl-CoA hydratase
VPIRSERVGHIGVLTIDRPEVRNAVDAAHAAVIGQILDEWEADDEVWVVIVTGAGNQAFSAGMDLKARHAANEAGERRGVRGAGFAGITHRNFPKPLVAAVNGVAMGGGFEVCLTCDLVIAEEHARFALSEVKRGVFAGSGGVERLVRRIPYPLAAEYIMTGEFIDARRALELGLVNRVVPSGAGLDAAVDLADRICQNSPFAIQLSKRLMRLSASVGEADLEGAVQHAIDELMQSADMREGVAAFNEKRAPQWTGR